MVVFDGSDPSPIEQSPWALVEIKRGYIDADALAGRRTDRDKLLALADLFGDDPPYLICCGSLNAEGRSFHYGKAAENHDAWYEAGVVGLPSWHEPAYFAARVIGTKR
jgi:hypothetical protein